MTWPLAAHLATSLALAIVVATTTAPTPASSSNAAPDDASADSGDTLSASFCALPSAGRQTVRVAPQGNVFDVLVYVPGETADAEDLVLAAPTGGIPDGDLYSWNIPGVPLANGEDPPPDARDDLQFISDIADTLVNRWGLDPDRVYATGYSGGGRMSSALACELASIAAIAPAAAQAWAQSNGCHLGPVHDHTWPGSTHDFGEPVSHEVPANATMWRFFEQHPRR